MSDPSSSLNSPDPSSRRQCTGKTKRGPCRKSPVHGATVCTTHGGSAPQVRAAAARRVALVEWTNVYGAPVDTDPASAVLDMLAWTAGHVAWLREQVQGIAPHALVWGVANETDRQSGEFPGLDVTRAAVANMWLQLYGQERDRLVRMSEVAHRMGIEARQVALAERLGTACLDLIRGVLDDLDLSTDQRAAAAEAVPRRLALVTAALNVGGAAS